MTDAERMLKAGDCLSNLLGIAIAAMEDGTPFTEMETQIGRSAILGWQMVKGLAIENREA